MATRTANWRRRERVVSSLFVLPALGVLALVVVFPIAFTFVRSFTDWTLTGLRPTQFIGLGNYAEMATEPRVGHALWRTLVITVGSLALQMVLGIAMALAMNKHFFGRGVMRTLAILPIVSTPVAISLVFVTMMHPSLGVLNYLLGELGLGPSLWIYDRMTVIPSIILVETWQWTPFVMLIALAGLSSLPKEPFESAVIDGGNRWQIFWHVTLPMLIPTLFIALLFRTIDSMKMFDTIYAMTKGGPGTSSETLNLYLFTIAFDYFRMGYGSSVVVALLVLVLGVALIMIKYRRTAYS